MLEYLDKLNPEQKLAATSVIGQNFVLAGAGSGKTSTLIARVAYMLDSGVEPENILLLTFTNKAAREMRVRLDRLVGDKASKIMACTFHSFCAAILRKYGDKVGVDPKFVVIDESDAEDAINYSKQKLFDEMKRSGFVLEKNWLREFPRTADILRVNSFAVNTMCDPEYAVRQSFAKNMRRMNYDTSVLEILDKYAAYKKEHSLVDYDDLLYYADTLLSNNEPCRKEIDKQYRFIACDEYQDTNAIQNDILDNISKDYTNITVVGDDNQSIYAFRFADINNILDFDKKYPHCKTIILNTNYRSTQEILDTANAVMSHATEGKEKNLVGLTHGDKPELVKVPDSIVEAAYIVDKIQKRTGKLKDIAVIVRSARQSVYLEAALNKKSIPYNKFGGKKFMEKAVIKDLIAYIRVAANMKDEIALSRVLKLYCGIGNAGAREVSVSVAAKGVSGFTDGFEKKKYYNQLVSLRGVIEQMQGKTPEEQIDLLVHGYYYELVEENVYNSSSIETVKAENLKRISESTRDAQVLVEMSRDYSDVSGFLQDVALEAVTKATDEKDKLNITTIHSAKGLEYDTVFIMDCIEYVTPRCEQGSPTDPEELRCMYVALTRAKNKLYIMWPEYYNIQRIDGQLSHYLDYSNVLDTLNIT